MQTNFKLSFRLYTAFFLLSAAWYNLDLLVHVPHSITRVVMVLHVLLNVWVLLFVFRKSERLFGSSMMAELKLLGVINTLLILPIVFFSFESDAVFFLSITLWVLSFISAALLKHASKSANVIWENGREA